MTEEQNTELLERQVEAFNAYIAEQVEPLYAQLKDETDWYAAQILEVFEAGHKIDPGFADGFQEHFATKIMDKIIKATNADKIAAQLPDGDNPIFRSFLRLRTHRVLNNACLLPNLSEWVSRLPRLRKRPIQKPTIEIPKMKLSLEEITSFETGIKQCLKFALEHIEKHTKKAHVRFSSGTFPLLRYPEKDEELYTNAHWIPLYETLSEIMFNAIRALPEGGEVKINCLQKNDEIHLTFEDNGVGISPEDLPHIFTPKFTTRPEMGGTGLGLSLVKAYIENIGGTIEVESTLGEGTTFTVKLKAVPAPPPVI